MADFITVALFIIGMAICTYFFIIRPREKAISERRLDP